MINLFSHLRCALVLLSLWKTDNVNILFWKPLTKSLCGSPDICQVGVHQISLQLEIYNLCPTQSYSLVPESVCLLIWQRVRRCMLDLRKMPPFKPLNNSEVHKEGEEPEAQEVMELNTRLWQEHKACLMATCTSLLFFLKLRDCKIEDVEMLDWGHIQSSVIGL